jgi:hypothetical protein
MPHLILEFKADRDVQEIAGQLVPTGKDHISFRMIDTDHGKVIELEADAKNIRQVERAPSWGETKIATETLGRTPGADTVDAKIHEAMRAERDKLKTEMESAKADLVAKNRLVLSLNQKIQDYEASDVTEGRDLLASALDSYLEELAASQDFDRYNQGKRIYRQLTGEKWVDDGEDDEEGDLSA